METNKYQENEENKIIQHKKMKDRLKNKCTRR